VEIVVENDIETTPFCELYSAALNLENSRH
jgi:hypothetical protein